MNNPRVTIALLGVSCALLMSCGPSLPRTLGEIAADNVHLSESPALSHLAEALGRDPTVAELFTDPELDFRQAPDPTPLFDGWFQAARSRDTLVSSRRLTVLTYNVGLLDRPMVLGVIDRVMVPDLEARRAKAPDLVLSRGYDIVLLQEVWEERDILAFQSAAKRHGYRVYAGSDAHRSGHGLAILVREELCGDDNESEARHEILFEVQFDFEEFPGPGFRRGYLLWRLTTVDGYPLRIYNTHFTPLTVFQETWKIRMAQSRELGLAIATAPPDELILVGGDFNAGPYYHRDVWQLPDGSESAGWWSHAVSYPLLLHYGGLRDLLLEARPPQDVTLGTLIPNNADRAQQTPYGSPGYCDRTPATVFTYTECNRLAARGTTGEYPPERLDQLFYRPGGPRISTVDVRLVFHEHLSFAGVGDFELSDHYGVLADLRVERP